VTNPDELARAFSGRWRRFAWIAFFAVVALAVAAYPLARPAWRQLKGWRADQFLRQSDELLAEGQISLAFERARQALQLVPSRPDAIRQYARILSLIGSEVSISTWERLLSSGEATADDRAAFVETALAFERPDIAAAEVARMLSAPDVDDHARRLAALWHVQRRERGAAIEQARAAWRDYPANPTNGLFLADLLIEESGDPALEEAREVLRNIAQKQGPTQIEALRRLVVNLPPRREDLERAHELLQLQSGSLNSAGEALLAETKILLNPAREGEVVSNLVARIRRDDWDQITEIVGVLQRRGRHQEILALTTAGRSLMTRGLFLARYEALRATGQREEAYRHLLASEAPMAPFPLAVMRARGAQDAGNTDSRDGHLRDLIAIAGDHPILLARAADLAEAGRTRNSRAIAMEAWKKLADRPDFKTNALLNLQRLADAQGDTWSARDYARKAARLGVTNAEHRVWIAYYDLLLDENVDGALAEAERQIEAGNDGFMARVTAALGHLRVGAPEKARATLDRMFVSPQDARTGPMAVLVATFGANGLEPRARELAGTLPLDALRPEELALIRPWLSQPPLGFPGLATP
jgi:hypothetical protein